MALDANDDDEAEKQQRAFQEFMLSGGGGGGGRSSGGGKNKTNSKKKKQQYHRPPPSPSLKTPATSTPTTTRNNNNKDNSGGDKIQQSRYSNSNKKFITTKYRAYQRTLYEWLETDNQLERVVDSVHNLRKRCWNTSKSLAMMMMGREEEKRQEGEFYGNCVSIHHWKNYGYRAFSTGLGSGYGGLTGSLTIDDLQVTLTDELVQHEKMMSLCRKLLSQLAQNQEAMGRRLDEIMILEMDTIMTDYYDRQEEEDYDDCSVDMNGLMKGEECRQLYAATARELYRKQTMAQSLFDSVDGSLLLYYYSESELGDSNDKGGRQELSSSVSGSSSSRRVADKCAKQWSRNCDKSELNEYSTYLNDLADTHNNAGSM